MPEYLKMEKQELKNEFETVRREYEALRSLHLSLDMSRGKPGFDNMDLSEKMFDLVGNDTGFKNISGIDCRNYGGLDGLTEMKDLFAEILDLKPEQIIVGGNSSLNMMFDTIAQAMTHGMGGAPWYECKERKFLCPVPGYDRHFAIAQYFGFKLIPIAMDENGPDMDEVEKWVKDETVKGIWCVPKYSNPQGYTYSEETVKRFARLKPAAPDFRLYWDNAYSVHHLYDDDQDFCLEILAECAKAGNPDLVYKFTSTSKISFPGSGVAAIATSKNNVADILKQLTLQTIGHDKVNQLRHVRYFHDLNGIHEHMKKHAAILRPKFELLYDLFNKELAGTGIAEWTTPKGGYFISFNSMEGCAKKIVQMAKEAGVVLTAAGATYPYGKDPQDSNIRIAPSYPTVEDLAKAGELFVLCVKLASVEKLLAE